MPSSLLAIIIVLAGVATPFAIFALRHRARRQPVTLRAVTSAQRDAVRAFGRWSMVGFVVFWIAAIALIAAAETIWDTPAAQSGVYAAVLVMAAASITLHLQIRCPACGYRLGYQRSLGVPPHCERCGTVL